MAVSEMNDLEKATGSPDGEISESRIVKPQAAIESLPDDDSGPAPLLRTLTLIREMRANTHIRRGFLHYMHDQKAKAKTWLGEGRREPLDGEGDPLNDDMEISHIDFLHRYSILSSRVKVLRHISGEDDKLMDPGVASEVLHDLSEYSRLTALLGSR